MAVVVTKMGKLSLGNIRGCLASVAFASGDYSNGVTVTPASVGLGNIEVIIVLGSTGNALAAFYWDEATSKIRGTGSTATPGLNQETSAAQAAAASPITILALGDNANKG